MLSQSEKRSLLRLVLIIINAVARHYGVDDEVVSEVESLVKDLKNEHRAE